MTSWNEGTTRIVKCDIKGCKNKMSFEGGILDMAVEVPKNGWAFDRENGRDILWTHLCPEHQE